PSGHSADIATSAFCLCLLLARPWQRAWVLGFAALIGLTRILLAKHWASDVLAGSAVGLTVAALIAGFWLRRLATGDAPA
ncbi:MAG TPA: phosphatase PAP2 family protein, partial [Plasticicumulans sp.]|nr:phosphatase PAP2 family protein [Plasticicumulans sp.]